MRNSEKGGVSGATNAKHQPYRLVGGDHQSPLMFGLSCGGPRQVQPSDYHDTSTFEIGLIGGLLAARLGFKFNGSEQLEAQLSGS